MTGKIKEGDVVVIRHEGPKGGPGRHADADLRTDRNGLGSSVALITDGRFSGNAVQRLAMLHSRRRRQYRTADSGWRYHRCDITGRQLNVRVSEEELANAAA